MIEQLWEEFVETVREDAGVLELTNFLGGVEKHKALFMKAAHKVLTQEQGTSDVKGKYDEKRAD